MLTLPWSCSFHSNDITQSVSDPFFRVSVLLSLELDSKFVGTALSSPYTVTILQGIRENIFMSISLLSKVFSSSHPKPWYWRFCQIRKRRVCWSLTFRLNFRFQAKMGEGRGWECSVLHSFSDFTCEIVLTLHCGHFASLRNPKLFNKVTMSVRV